MSSGDGFSYLFPFLSMRGNSMPLKPLPYVGCYGLGLLPEDSLSAARSGSHSFHALSITDRSHRPIAFC